MDNNYVSTKLKKAKFYLTIAVIGLTIFTVLFSASYAFFTTRTESKNYIVYTGNLKVDFESNGGNVINMTGIPMLDSDGLNANNNEYSFKVVNNGSIDARYQVRLELDDTVSNVPIEYIRLSYKKNDGTYSEPVSLSDLNGNLVFTTNNILSVQGEDTIYIKLWVSINAGNEIQGKTFKSRIVIDSIQNVEDGYEVDTKPIIVLNKDKNNNIDQIIALNSTYTELGVKEVKDDKDILTPNDVTITGTVDTTTVGVYTVTYSVTDSNNETTTTTRTVAVGDEETLNIKKTVPEVLAMYTSEQQSSNEAIVCSHIYGTTDLYLDCSIESTLDNAVNKKNTSTIILTKDINRNSWINISNEKNFILNLNGKKIERATTGNLISNSGTLVIEDSVGNGKLLNSSENEGYNGIVTFGITTINGGTIEVHGSAAALYSGSNQTRVGKVVVNSGNINSIDYASILVYSSESDALEINGGNFNSKRGSVVNQASGSVQINGGKFVSNDGNAILNASTGTINIEQNDTPIYIKTTATSFKPAIRNNNGGIISIKSSQANQCTSNASDTTSGLCVYADGNGTYTDNNGNAALFNYVGNAYVDGGTYYGGYVGVETADGILNIKNAIVTSNSRAVYNYGSNVINICNSTINGSVVDLFNRSDGTINYSSDVIFSNGTNTPTNVYNPSGTINSNYTCPATWTNS